MPQLTTSPSKDSSLRRLRTKTSEAWGPWEEAKGEYHALGGYHTNGLQHFRSLVQFDTDWNDVAKLIKAELVMVTVNDHAGFVTQKYTGDNILVGLKRKSWTEQGGGEEGWLPGTVDADGAEWDSTYQVDGHISGTDGAVNTIDVTAVVRALAPTTVRGPDNKACLGKPNYGFVLSVTSGSSEREWVVASKEHPDVPLRPFLRITYDPKGGPGLTFGDAPTGPVAVDVSEFFVGHYEPGRPDDNLSRIEVAVTDDATGDRVWTGVTTGTSNDVVSNTFMVKYPVLKTGIDYRWSARVTNQRGETTPFSDPLTFRLTTLAPAVALVGPSGSHETLQGVFFEATFTDPQGDHLSQVQVQVRDPTPPGDPTWDTGGNRWDTGLTLAWKTERDSNNVRRPYQGSALPAGNYAFRIRAADRYGARSGWVYGTFTLTKGYEPSPGETSLLTGYARRQQRHRIRIFKMGALRGPGALVAEIYDGSNVGATEYYNSPGEFFFSVPATHPQVSVIEPFQTHYSLELYRGEGWKPIHYGLITDYDATEDEVVFYGTDYPGVLALLSDERFNLANPDLPVESGGGKYVDDTITSIVIDQLTRAKNATNSPVGFINIGDITDLMSEKVTIHATFKERLGFISGLIDSHRAGTGRRTRLLCQRNADGTFEWRVIFESGQDRDNLRMEYGSLIQGFQVIPFGSWGTKVHGIGRTIDGTKPFYSVQKAPGIDEAIWGSFPRVNMWQDIDDTNDLARRTKQAAIGAAKVGKRMALGIRLDALDIKDGWDITDSVPVVIQRGVVDTTRFGSHYWTIWGWSWASFPDGHTETGLTLLPREDETPPNPDLIPSAPILNQPEWGVEARPPTVDDPESWWLDSSTGDIWVKNPDGTWTNTGNIMGPPGTSGSLVGDYIWVTAPDTTVTAGQVSVALVPGRLKVNTLYIAQTDANGSDRGAYLNAIEAGDALLLPVGSFLWRVEVSAFGTDHGAYWTFPVVWPGHPLGQPANNSPTRISLTMAAKMPIPGSGLGRYEFGPVSVPPPPGRIATKVGTTTRVPNGINIADTDLTSVTRRPYLLSVRMGDTILVDDGDGTLMKVVVDGAPIDHGTYFEFPFTDIQPVITLGVAVDASVASPGAAGPAGPIGLPLGDWKWEDTRGLPPPGYVALSLPPLVPDGGAPGDRLLDDITGEPLYPDLP